MCSNASESVPAPDPRAIARSMFSFGIEYERAFSIAFCRARLPAGSGPPSRAATMIARASFEKSLPRFASAAPFLCLIDDHLLCPDMRLFLDELQKAFMDPRVVGQLRVERGDDEPTFPKQHRLAVQLGYYLDMRPRFEHARCANEHAAERLAVIREREVGLEARYLTPVRVPVDLQVDGVEVVSVEHDHPGAGSEDRTCELAHGLVEPVKAHQPHERRRFAAGNHQPVEPVKLLWLADFDHIRPEPPQHRRVLAKVALQGQDADCWGLEHAVIVGSGSRWPAKRERSRSPSRSWRSSPT